MMSRRDDDPWLALLVAQLRDRRRALGMSQDQMATDIGTTQSAVSEMETGAVTPTMRTLRRYAAALGADVRIELDWWRQPKEEKT